MGSSPLARGLHQHDRIRIHDHGIIPARAGFTPQRRRRRRPSGIIPARAGFTDMCGRTARTSSDHPRSRGVYVGGRCGAYAPQGSSPLARGLPAILLAALAASRIIPARAGFTRARGSAPHTWSDHPRSRGVYPSPMTTGPGVRGSSPLARGLPLVSELPARAIGIIPARAGFTHGFLSSCVGPQDHPRSRGVYCPRGRNELIRQRIIPARAGFTSAGFTVQYSYVDHPRSRGVYLAAASGVVCSWGSSPLARGLLCQYIRPACPRRIIPARAGFTRFDSSHGRDDTDHPRSRGVYSSPSPNNPKGNGSSPLARGLPITPFSIPPRERIIPARAGFTHCRPRRGRRPRDHPRSRGVYPALRRGLTSSPGSSPLARGLLLPTHPHACLLRIIPARAGFT